MAPSFDHATSLGRELLDESPRQICRHRLLQEGRVGAYSESGHGAIFWQCTDKHGLSPLELVRRAAREHPDTFVSAIRRAHVLRREQIEAVIARVPPDWMTPLARKFALELIAYNVQKLQVLCT